MTAAVLILLPVAALVSAVLTGIARRVALRVGFVDRPGGRKAHDRPVPLGGGVAVFATVVLLVGGGMAAAQVLTASGGAWGASSWLPAEVATHLPGMASRAGQVWGLLAVAGVLHAFCVWDDARTLGPWTKLAVQTACAAAVVFGVGLRATAFLPVAGLPEVLSILWIVLLANSFNFLDNMDGLCASVAALCGTVLLGAALLNGEWFVAAWLCVLVGAAAGFLVHNRPPAAIFLGDAGSQVIGFLLACVPFAATYYGGKGGPDPAAVGETAARMAVLAPVVAFAVPLYDTASVMFIRLREGRPPWMADRSHFSHRLRSRGLSVGQTLLTVCLVTVAASSGAMLLGRVPMVGAVVVLVQCAAVLGVLATLELSVAEQAPTEAPRNTPPDQVPPR